MSRYLLIESKSPIAGGEFAFELAGQLCQLGHGVTIYLIQDGVFASRARFEAGEKLLARAKAHRVAVLADEVSLRQRGLTPDRRDRTVRASKVEELTDLLMEDSDKAVWH